MRCQPLVKLLLWIHCASLSSAAVVSITPPLAFREGEDEPINATIKCTIPGGHERGCLWFLPDGSRCRSSGGMCEGAAEAGLAVEVEENADSCWVTVAGRKGYQGTWTCRLYTEIDRENQKYEDAITRLYRVSDSKPNISRYPEMVELEAGDEIATEDMECKLENPGPVTRFTWRLNEAVIREHLLDSNTLNSSSFAETPPIATDSISIQVMRKNFRDMVSCTAEKLQENSSPIFPSAATATTTVQLDMVLAPEIMEESYLMETKRVEIVLEAFPAIREGSVLDIDNNITLFTFNCSIVDIGVEETTNCSIEGETIDFVPKVLVLQFAKLSQSKMSFIFDGISENMNVSFSFESERFGETVHSSIFEIFKDDSLSIDKNENIGGNGGEKSTSGSVVAYVAVPLVLISLCVALFLVSKRWNLLKCGEYSVVNDISETEL